MATHPNALMRWTRRDSNTDSTEDWLLPFTDMTIFLLSFFVIMYTAEKMDGDQSQVMQESVQIALGEPEAPIEAVAIIEYSDVLRAVREHVERNHLNELTTIRLTQRGVELSASGELLFESGSVDLKPRALGFLGGIAKLTAEMPYHVIVEGHTDDVPISTARFPSNWELSTSRAASVARSLIAGGLAPDRLTATGFADTRPLADNEQRDLKIRRRHNRRVVLVFRKPV